MGRRDGLRSNKGMVREGTEISRPDPVTHSEQRGGFNLRPHWGGVTDNAIDEVYYRLVNPHACAAERMPFGIHSRNGWKAYY